MGFTLRLINEDSFDPYVIFEYISNFSVLHGLMANSADEALQEHGELGIEAINLQAVAVLDFN